MTELSASDKSHIREIVASVLRDRFPKIQVASINVRARENEDQDQEVEIAVVFQAARDEFDPKEIPSFLTDLIGELNQARESRFPIVSFIEKSDLGTLEPEAA